VRRDDGFFYVGESDDIKGLFLAVCCSLHGASGLLLPALRMPLNICMQAWQACRPDSGVCPAVAGACIMLPGHCCAQKSHSRFPRHSCRAR
jgi:hypothetical protein